MACFVGPHHVPDEPAAPAGTRGSCSTHPWLGMLRRCIRAVLVAYLIVVLLAMLLENHLIFLPSRYPNGDWDPPDPAVEDAYFHAADGTRLHGWYLEHDRARAYVVFFHGNAGNITNRADLLKGLHDEFGLSVLLFDYRGYGKSEGRPNEAGVLADGRAARAWLARRAGIDETDIVLMGRSLGGAVAVDLAAEKPCRGLVLESTFTTMPDVAAFHYRWLPVRWLMRTRLDSLSKIGRYHGPLLQSHSVDDEIVPYAQGRELFEAAAGEKEFVTMEGLQHNDPPSAEYCRALDRFLRNLGAHQP